MNVWLVRTEDFEIKSLAKIEELLNAYDGPLIFKCRKEIIPNSISKSAYKWSLTNGRCASYL